jgi:transposase-like protein
MTKYRCTECDKTYTTLEAAARCHWGIGGVKEEEDND